MYRILRFFLFLLPAETSHDFALRGLAWLQRRGLLRLLAVRVPEAPVDCFGLRFPNPVGLAAGLDKNGDYIDALGALGFGFIEVGTVTPRPQPGNPRPRLFRLPAHQAIINRMGFNNKGLEHLVERLKTRRWQGVLGVNIGKNFSTPVENALDDYLACLRGVYAYADYVTINLSSPNTPGLRNLQFGAELDRLLAGLKEAQGELRAQHGRYVPLLVKIAPDLDAAQIREIAESLLRHGIDGAIATNTTVSRQGVQDDAHKGEQGGLSGAPLAQQSTRVLEALHRDLGGAIGLIGVGGITDWRSAAAKRGAGATLVQLYTGFIYRGPTLIAEAAAALDPAYSAP